MRATDKALGMLQYVALLVAFPYPAVRWSRKRLGWWQRLTWRFRRWTCDNCGQVSRRRATLRWGKRTLPEFACLAEAEVKVIGLLCAECAREEEGDAERS